MNVKILNTDSEYKELINKKGNLILNETTATIILDGADNIARFLRTSKIKNIKIETINSTYELEVI